MNREIELIDEFLEEDVTLDKIENEIDISDDDPELNIEIENDSDSDIQIDEDSESEVELDTNDTENEISMEEQLDEIEAEILSIFGAHDIELSPEDIVIDLDYEHLKNRPFINGVEILGKKMFRQLGLIEISNEELDELMN